MVYCNLDTVLKLSHFFECMGKVAGVRNSLSNQKALLSLMINLTRATYTTMRSSQNQKESIINYYARCVLLNYENNEIHDATI